MQINNLNVRKKSQEKPIIGSGKVRNLAYENLVHTLINIANIRYLQYSYCLMFTGAIWQKCIIQVNKEGINSNMP